MMYSEKLAVAIKHNGKILRENKDLVQLPFGSEFSVLVKNLNSRRVKFTLHIDGTDVLEGTEIIVNANSEVEMKRFIRNGNMNEGNAFKFIERTAAIEDGPRGIKVDDGIVRVEFWFEKEAPEVKTTIHNHHDYWRDRHYRTPLGGPWYTTYSSTKLGADTMGGSNIATKGIMRADGATTANAANAVNQVFSSNASLGNSSSVFADASSTLDNAIKQDLANEAGITVPGSKVAQTFTTVYGFNAEVNSHVITLRIAGKVGKIEVAVPVTVKSKQKCTTCGHTNKHSARFCTDCGTALELV